MKRKRAMAPSASGVTAWATRYIASRQVQKLSAGSRRFSARAGHGALEGVGMEVRHTRHHGAADSLQPLAAVLGGVRRDARDRAVGRDVDPHIPRPAGGAAWRKVRAGSAWADLFGVEARAPI